MAVSDIDHLGLMISHATAPAFRLRAVAAFLSILIQRKRRLSDRIRALRADDSSGADSKEALLHTLDRRVLLLGRAINFGALTGRHIEAGPLHSSHARTAARRKE